MLKFLPNQKTSQLSPLYMCKCEKQWYIYNLLDLLNNPTEFLFNWIRKHNFQLRQFDLAVTLKYG